MADELRMALEELLRKAQMEEDAGFLREGVRVLSQALMELEVSQQLGARRYERAPERTGHRNGYRDRPGDTRVGTIQLKVPKVREGSYYPSLLDPRQRAERALVAVVQEAYVQGVSPRRVDDLVQALGMNGVSKSQVSRLCQELEGEVERFRSRKLEGDYPYVWLDDTFVKVRDNGRVVSMAVVIASGVKATGEREVLGLDVGHSEDGAFWTQFLRGLVARGRSGVRLVISDAHEGLKGAIAAVLQGAAWQRWRVHFVRNALALVPKAAAPMVAATINAIHLHDEGLQQSSDDEIIAKAQSEGRVILTHDLDFGRIVALSQAGVPSVITFRLQDMRPVRVNRYLIEVLTRFAEQKKPVRCSVLVRVVSVSVCCRFRGRSANFHDCLAACPSLFARGPNALWPSARQRRGGSVCLF